MSHYRVDPTRIKTTDTVPCIKGGQGIVVIGTLVPSEASNQLLPELRGAVKKLYWRHDDAEESTKFFKVFSSSYFSLTPDILNVVPQSFVHELSLMITLSHPNIVKLVGFVEDIKKGDAWMILPWESNGNIREFLQSGEWDIPERVSLVSATCNDTDFEGQSNFIFEDSRYSPRGGVFAYSKTPAYLPRRPQVCE